MAGLVHGHAAGFLSRYRDSKDIELVGIAEPDRDVAARYIQRSRLDPSSVHPSLEAMLDRAKPQAVVAFTSTADHLAVVQACGARKIPVMMEKPLAVSVEQARAIERISAEAGIPVLVNYETTWYPSNHAAYALAREKALGEIRKVVVHDGHRGPKEIGVQPEFLAWLTDPEQNGGRRAVRLRLLRRQPDDLADGRRATDLRDGRDPAVQARDLPEGRRRGHDRPGVPGGAGDHPGVVELAVRPEGHGGLRPHRAGADGGPERPARPPGGEAGGGTPGARPQVPEDDFLRYFAAVVRGEIKPSGLSSLRNNLIVVEILDAARRSAATGSTVPLT